MGKQEAGKRLVCSEAIFVNFYHRIMESQITLIIGISIGDFSSNLKIVEVFLLKKLKETRHSSRWYHVFGRRSYLWKNIRAQTLKKKKHSSNICQAIKKCKEVRRRSLTQWENLSKLGNNERNNERSSDENPAILTKTSSTYGITNQKSWIGPQSKPKPH